MTLIEVMIALAILSFVLVSMAAYLMRFASGVATDNNRTIAASIAADRLETIRGTLRYVAVDSFAVVEDTVANFPGFARTTTVTRDSNSTVDHKRVTVAVTGPKLPAAIRRSIVIARF
ncbi:MAG: hypothetical protein M3081_08265 [Gemmatimonadota bacterium]|nr:hypothetical protein [Gemmatimonadota bacterium]